MCGRFVMIESEEKVMQTFEIQQSEMMLEPRYNICPSQDIPVIVQQDGLRSLEMRQWGFIPFWSKEPTPMINARAEMVSEKPFFRQAFRKQRCLIPATGFYEWAKEEGQKQPYFISLKSEIYDKGNSMMAFAGLWDSWTSPEGELRRTCTILTVAQLNTPNYLFVKVMDEGEVVKIEKLSSLTVKFRPLRQKMVYQFHATLQNTGANSLLRIEHSNKVKIVEEL